MNESEKQFSFTRAASSTSGRTEKKILISSALALDPTHQLVNLKYVFRDFHSHLGGSNGIWHPCARKGTKSSANQSVAHTHRAILTSNFVVRIWPKLL